MMKVNPQEIQSVVQLSAKERYEYAMKRILDQEEIWFLDDDGWVTYGDDAGNIYLPIWSAEVFAKMNAVSQWENAQPEKLELETFLQDSVPELIEQNISIAIFPIAGSDITSQMDILSFCHQVNQNLDEWYGECYDLPYLK